MKPEEEEQFRKTMLAMAADEIRARAAQSPSARAGASQKAHAALNSGKTVAGRLVQPIFDDVQLRVFDLGNVNEPELILTAKAHMPEHSPGKGTSSSAQTPNNLQYMITLVARGDVNGDFHKGLVNITDTQHLDAIPRLDLIDAVDVNGDGRGELLFRQVSEAGSAFVVYSVIGDRLYRCSRRPRTINSRPTTFFDSHACALQMKIFSQYFERGRPVYNRALL